jgi:Tetratricopeptide repeat
MHRLEIGFLKIQDSIIRQQPDILYPQRRHGDFDYKFRRTLVPHIDSCLELHQCSSTILKHSNEDQLEMATKFSLALAENGRLREPMELRKKVLEARQRTLGNEHPNTLTTMAGLATRYSKLGRHQEAIGLREKTLEARQRTLAPCYSGLYE